MKAVTDDERLQAFADADEEQIHPDGIAPRSTLEPSSMSVPLHILSLRRIASETRNRVHSIQSGLPQGEKAKEETIRSLHTRLIEWRRNMPFPIPDLQSNVPHLCTNWFDLNYYTHLTLLYRPSPLYRTLDLNKVRILADASAKAIRQAVLMHRQHRFSYNWLNLFGVFNSSLSLIYATAAQPDHLGLFLEQTKATSDLELAVELLETFSLKFPSARKLQRMVNDVLARLRVYADE